MKSFFSRLLSIVFTLAILITCTKDDTPEPIEKFSLSTVVEPSGSGSITPSSGDYEKGQTVKLIVSANEHYKFKNWSGDASGASEEVSIVMNGNKTIKAIFEKKDDDADGVTNDIDSCPDTPSGESVDENGCSSSQKDTDGDGVMDNVDTCPDTPSGETVDENGCTVFIYLDSNGITIKCYDYAQVGQKGTVNGIEYTIVDESTLRVMVANEEDLTKVCTTKVSNMKHLFVGSTSNQDISSWDVRNVTDMTGMFSDCFTFNRDISFWDVSSVTNMNNMFQGSPFNYDISSWNVSNVTDMHAMFSGGAKFNQDIGSWDVSSVTNMSYMFFSSQFNQDLSSWSVSNVTNCNAFSVGANSWTLPQPNFTNCNPN